MVLSSILLGTWAVKDTIALRNILLCSGSIFSIYYIVQEWRYGQLKEQCSIWKMLPLFLLGLTFVWVVSHYLLFSVEPLLQFQELESTWLRAFMAFVIGLASGLALRNHPNRLYLLWLGIFIAFCFLFYQYIPRALSQNKLLVPDYDHYLFHLKFNVVLMGMILIAGICGILFDHLYAVAYRWSNLKPWYLLYWLLGNGLALWAFVYIVDSRNGTGLTFIFYSFWFIYAVVFFIKAQVCRLNVNKLLVLILPSIGLCLTLFFLSLQVTVNNSWNNLVEDVKIAVQIDRYPNWSNLRELGMPKRANGQPVVGNTYERVAWAVAGSRAIIAKPEGVGLLAYPFALNPHAPRKMIDGTNPNPFSTHSGWVEFGLAFGLPFLCLIFSALSLTFIEATRHSYPSRLTVVGFLVLIAFLFTVGENSTKHGVEILYYLLALLPALLLTTPSKKI